MSPTRTASESPLLDHTRSLASLKHAWEHVRPRAVQSRDDKIQRERALIERDSLGYLRRLQRDLASEPFVFDQQKAVLKRRSGKDPRPIVVSPLRNRIVQRAILNTCQTDQQRLRRRLGGLPTALVTSTSVGGLPNRGVSDALRLIKEAVTRGATHYVRSDIKSFFAQIPKQAVHLFLDSEVTDLRFVSLFKAGLETELHNADDAEIRKWWDLFPDEETGVPQGSALSAISANIVLADFDQQLNRTGLVTIRYLDDFLILGNSADAVERGWVLAVNVLAALGLEAHQPGESSKAARGIVRDGFDFLSFHVTNSSVAPSKAAKAAFLTQIEDLVRDAKPAIMLAGGEPRRAQSRFVQTLQQIDRKTRGWGDAFRESNQRLVFAQLDERINSIIESFVGWFLKAQRDKPAKARRRMWGIALLADTPRADGDNS